MQLITKRLVIIPCTERALKSISPMDKYQFGLHINRYIEELKKDASLLGWGVWLVID